MPAVYEHRVEVRAEDIDELDHVSNVAYVAWMLEAALAHTAAQGWPMERYIERGMAFVARSHSIQYVRQTRRADPVVVVTWVAEMSRIRSLRRYEIRHAADRGLLARAETDWAFIDIGTGRPMRIPDEVSRCFVVTEGPGT